MPSSVYDFTVKSLSGEEVSLAKFRGKSLLIVNTASFCGYTPQYEGLQKLHEEFKGNLEVLAFPCNQFGAQEPGEAEEIKDFCETKFRITFPIFEKIDVNGSDAHPLYQYLKESLPGVMGTEAIKWNFTKFLVDGNGKPLKRFAPMTTPEEMRGEIRELIAKN